jgi:ankyrin repeat protein
MSRKFVQMLTENVTNINLRNDRGQTALHKASRRGDIDIIRIILNHGADVDTQDDGGSTPLHLVISSAPFWDKEQAVGVLLEHGANINLRNHEGQTALHEAIRCSSIITMHLILKHSPDVNALDNNSSTPLHLAISDVHFWDVEEAVGLLLERGANINLRNGQGQTALHKASLRCHTDIIGIILNHGADVDAQDNDGSTPLHLTISQGSMSSEPLEVIKLLLEHGASSNRENNRGETPFQVAEVRGLQEITGLLSIHIQSERTA